MEQGTKNLSELLTFVVALVVAIVESLEDGKLGISDIFKFFGALKKAAPAFKGMTEIREEIANINETKKAALTKQVSEELKLDNTVVEQYIEQALALAISLLDLIPLGVKVKK